MLKRKLEIIAGILFFMATIGYLTGDNFVKMGLSSNGNITQVNIGIMLELINVLSVILIAICLSNVISHHAKITAMGYCIFRILEALLLSISLALPLIQVEISKKDFITQEKSIEINEIFSQAYIVSFQLGMFFLAIGGCWYCYILFRKIWIPKWMSILGVVGYFALGLSAILSIQNINRSISTYLYIPGAIFEIIFPIYLIVKGIKIDKKLTN